MEDEALAGIADRLYAGPLEDFIASRAAAAKEAAGQDKELAAAVRTLPKPSVAAWAVNMLVREQPGVVAGLAGLGGRMRAAQGALDAAALRELGRERRTLLTAAVDSARAVARGQGRAISDTMATDVEETLRAMTADEGAAAAVLSGRLLKGISADGVNAVDLDGAVALPGMLPASSAPPVPPAPAATAAAKKRTTPERTTQPKPAKPRLEAVRQAPRPVSPPALERAKAALAEAQADEAATARRAAELQDQADEAREAITALQQETAELRERLKNAEEDLDQARRKLSAASAEAKQAARAAEKAGRTAMLAQERVLRLGR